MFTIKVQVIRNTAHRPSMQASYTIGSGTTMQDNQPAAQIAAKHSIFPQMVPNMSWIFLVLVGIDLGVPCLGGKIDSHNTTDARLENIHVILFLHFKHCSEGIKSVGTEQSFINISKSYQILIILEGVMQICDPTFIPVH